MSAVLVVEDFGPLRKAISARLKKASQLQVIGEAADGLEAVSKAEELQPDLILMDIALPNLDGVESARQILQLIPQAKVIFVTQESSSEIVREALQLGAHGYVVKHRAAIDLMPAIRTVGQGRQFFSPGLSW